jgi:hypothetical protein
MSPFLNSLKDRLTAIEQEMQSLPGELDSVVAHLDRGKLRNLSLDLNRDFEEAFNQYLGRPFAGQGGWTFGAPFIIELNPPCIRRITNEDVQRWRGTYKADVRVVIGKGRVRVMAACELAKEYKTTVSQIILDAQRQGYTVLGWEQYQKLLDEIGSLIGEDKESLPGTIVGVPVTTVDSPQQVKILPQNSSL